MVACTLDYGVSNGKTMFKGYLSPVFVGSVMLPAEHLVDLCES